MINIATLITRCLPPFLLTTVALSTLPIAAQAGNMYIYKDKGGQVLLTNVNPSGNFDKFTKKVKTTYYKASSAYNNSGSSSNDYGSNSASASNDYGSSSASSSGSRR